MNRFIYQAASEAATIELGAALAELLPDGTTVALCGSLGAGKTRLVQAMAEATGVDRREVVSPTFVLIREYSGCRPLYHFDAYRVRDEDEFLELGPEEYFERDGLTVVEWADRVQRSLPRDRVEVRIEITGPQSRRFEVAGLGTRYAEVIARLQAWGSKGPPPAGSRP
ncbi:MAG: tRNA (adenosine(37)-N6)-threonylcarbamoyltransferase complex ATPase subunit type 1 TsaE [Planctomycetota bacterium]|jgi:tRNA threonylcarbamoyladenosine biosynthesis protein TsaE